MPVCAPLAKSALPSASFDFSAADGSMARSMNNVMTLWSAPYRAWWALTFEALDARNYDNGR